MVIDKTVKCEREGGRERERKACLWEMKAERKERHLNVSALVACLQLCSWKQIHLKLYSAGKENKATISQDVTFLIRLVISLVAALT